MDLSNFEMWFMEHPVIISYLLNTQCSNSLSLNSLFLCCTYIQMKDPIRTSHSKHSPNLVIGLMLLAPFVSINGGFGGLEAACWPLVPKFAGSNPAEAVGFFRAKKKILSTPSFGGEEKPFVPCRRPTACKRFLNVTWKSGIFRQNSSAISRPSSSSFHY